MKTLSLIRKRSPDKDVLKGVQHEEDEIMSDSSNKDDSEILEDKDLMALSDSKDEDEVDEKYPILRFSTSEKLAF